MELWFYGSTYGNIQQTAPGQDASRPFASGPEALIRLHSEKAPRPMVVEPADTLQVPGAR